jgi:acetylornithine deacetylase/succinyl-diaminopimelate desuccinylase-like protein
MKRIVAIVWISALLLSTGSIAQESASKARAYRQTHESQIIAEFSDLLSIPNVASDTPNIRRNAAKLIEMMSSRGIQSRLLEGDGPPAIYGELKTPGATRTIGLYAHYDGQPVDPAKWTTEPFKPVLRDKPLESGW